MIGAFPILVFPALLLAGCYAFVGDNEQPEWTPAPGDVTQGGGATAVGSGAGGPGEIVFNQKCAACHQMNGKGIPGVFPSLAGSEVATGDPVLSVRIVLHGFQGPITRKGQNYNGVMQPWKNELTDQQIADVVTYVRKSWGNAADAVEAAFVAKVRESTKSKVGSYTEAELKAGL